jgi:hypothetical protein
VGFREKIGMACQQCEMTVPPWTASITQEQETEEGRLKLGKKWSEI